MYKLVGTICGEVGLHEFDFIVSGEVRRNEYVKVWHELNGWILGRVVSIVDAVKKTATAEIIGYKDERGFLMQPKNTFSRDEKVFKADQSFIMETLGLKSGGIHLGMLDGRNIPVYLRKEELIQKHCSILAKTGSGKSYTAGVLIEELLEKNVPLLIIDPHGEYLSLKYENRSEEERKQMDKFGITPRGYASKVVVFTPLNFSINPAADKLFRIDGINLSVNELYDLFPLSDAQLGVLYQSINGIKEEKEFYTIEDIIKKVSESKSSAKWRIIHFLERIRETGILSDSPTRIEELVKVGKASIIDMKGAEPKLQQLIVYRICKEVFEGRKMGKIPPFMLVIEEAHNFCPERGFEKAVSSNILRTIASEGRKFGLGLLVISQRPARVDKNVISQCNTQIILRVTNPNDIRALSRGLEFMSAEMEEEIKRIPQGVALLSSPSIEMPILVDIRVRRSEHGGRAAEAEGEEKKEAVPRKRGWNERENIGRKSMLTRLLGE
ncbi:ATP-binding protein [Methanophagales archaeon]|nr:MAG: ATP-binding protein [Methanophagales archaeon]RJS77337.1 MAG: ATP-binding protein [Methanophagales archaeon]